MFKWEDYYMLFQRTRKEIGTCDSFIFASVTCTNGITLVRADGVQMHWPEFACSTEGMIVHFTACLLSFAGFGEPQELCNYLQYCDSLVATRDETGQVEITIRKVLSPPCPK